MIGVGDMIIFMMIGASSSGKDTIYKELPKRYDLDPVVIHTTRKMRLNEVDGETYHFDAYDKYMEYFKSNVLVASSKYTVYDSSRNPSISYYYTVKDDLLVGDRPKIVIGNPNLYTQYLAFLGKNVVYPIIISVNDGLRLERALRREKKQTKPNYSEMCRRFIKDSEDFSQENFKLIGLDKFPSFENNDLWVCIENVGAYIEDIIKMV